MSSPPLVRAGPPRPSPTQCYQDASPPRAAATTPADGGWAQVPGCLQPSQGAHTSAAGAGGARTPLAPTLTARIDRPRSLPLCCKRMFQLLQMFQRYIASVSYRWSKSRSRYCIYCNDYTCMLQASVLNVSFVFSDVCCKYFYLDAAYVSHICLKVFLSECCICFAMTFQVFLGVFASVSYACFKYFIFLQTHVAKV
jgi:hypothetical protein